MKANETNKVMYLIAMINGNKESYVENENDVEAGGFVDIDVDNFAFATEQEAQERIAELEEFSRSKGYILGEHFGFRIEEMPVLF